MSINLLVLSLIKQINELRTKKEENLPEETREKANKPEENNETSKPAAKDEAKMSGSEKNASALIFVILEICVKDLIKYLPDLLTNSSAIIGAGDLKTPPPSETINSPPSSSNSNTKQQQSSFLYLHVSKCTQMTNKDVEIIGNVLAVLNQLPFHSNIKFESNNYVNFMLIYANF